jgi:hypothetical protein
VVKQENVDAEIVIINHVSLKNANTDIIKHAKENKTEQNIINK